DRRIVHVVLDAFTEDVLQPDRAFLHLEVRAQVDSPTRRAARQIELIGQDVIPFHLAQQKRTPNIPPALRSFVRAGKVRQRKTPLYVLQLYAVRQQALVRARSRALDGEHRRGIARDWHPPKLDVPEEHHPGRSPVLE